LDGTEILHVFANDVELSGSPVDIASKDYDGNFSVVNGAANGLITLRRQTGGAPIVVTIIDHTNTIVAEGKAVFDASTDPPLFAMARFEIPLRQVAYGRSDLHLRAQANGFEFAKTTGDLPLRSYLDVLTPYRCAGWLFSPAVPQKQFEIEIFRDGEKVFSGVSGQPRPDLREEFAMVGDAGFDFTFNEITLPPLQTTQISIRLANSEKDLFGGPFIIGGCAAIISEARVAAGIAYNLELPLSKSQRSILRLAMEALISNCRERQQDIRICRPDLANEITTDRRLNVIIPIYRDIAITHACIESVLRHRTADRHSVVLVNDHSPDPAMAPMLQQFADQENVFLLTNHTNVGFIQSVNRAIRFCGNDDDIVLLNSDTRIFSGALDELWKIAYSSPDIATVTAMSNNATIFTYPHPELPVGNLHDVEWKELATAALHAHAGDSYDVPTAHGFCMLIRHEVLRQIDQLDERFGRGYGEENAFCLHASDLGYRHVAAAGVFVEHREGISFGAEKQALTKVNSALLDKMYPEYTPTVIDFRRRDGLRSARWALDVFRLRKASESGASFALIVDNWLDGGMKKTIADIEMLVGYGQATKLTLSCREDGTVILECEDLPLRSIFLADEVAPLLNVLSAARIDLIAVHQLLGFTEQWIKGFADWLKGHHAVYYIHDLYPVCPRVTLIDATGSYCNLPDSEICSRCVKLGGVHSASRLTELTPAEHRKMFGYFLERVSHVIAPSRNTANYLARAFPHLKVEVVPHPHRPMNLQAIPDIGHYDNVVLLGALGPHKGSSKLVEIAQRAFLTHPSLHFHVIGFTDRDEQLRGLSNVTITGAYMEDDLPKLIKNANARIALFLSSCPETFSYTLSQAAAHGLIPIVPDIGAPAERVRDAQFGVVVTFPISASEVLQMIDDLANNRVNARMGNVGPNDLLPTAASAAKTRKLYKAKGRRIAVKNTPLVRTPV